MITGASSGIGRELAGLFARDGFDLILCARDAAALEAVAQSLREAHRIDARIFPGDLSKPGSAAGLASELEAEKLRVDVLVNNAGAGHLGSFLETDLAVHRGDMQLNMVSLAELAHILGRAMAARGSGRILNVASTGAFQPGPGMLVYYATKAFVLSFSEALREELGPAGVTVTVACPGPTRTAFGSRAGVPDAWWVRASSMSSARAAAHGYRALMAGRRMSLPGFRNKLGAFLPRLLPRALTVKVVALLHPKRA